MSEDILVAADWAWTCQACLETVSGFDSEQAAERDGKDHKCADYGQD